MAVIVSRTDMVPFRRLLWNDYERNIITPNQAGAAAAANQIARPLVSPLELAEGQATKILRQTLARLFPSSMRLLLSSTMKMTFCKLLLVYNDLFSQQQ